MNSKVYNFLMAPTDNTALQATRYFIFGSIPTIVDMGLLWAFKSLLGEEHILLSAGIAFVIATFLQYYLSIKFVFNSRNVSSKAVEIAVFFCVRGCGLGWTELLMWALAVKAGMHYMLAKFIIVIIVFIWNFSANKVLLFRNKK